MKPGILRAVKKLLSSRLIMNSRWLWNTHQRHKFLQAEASRDILKFRVSEIAFPGFSRSIVHWLTILFDGAYFLLAVMTHLW